MQPIELSDFLKGLPAALITIVGGVGTAWRFKAWLTDHQDQAKFDSAGYFAKSHYTDWQKGFGEKNLVRIHFKRITGINRKSGHEAIVDLHRRLGGSDGDWDVIRKAGAYVVTAGAIASVRDFYPRDYVKAVFAALGGVMFLLFACYSAYSTVNRGQQALAGTAAGGRDFVILFFAAIYAVMFLLWAWVMFLQLREIYAAKHLRQRLATEA